MLPRPSSPAGGAEIVGVTAPGATSCVGVRSPASTSACPAGVSLPAPLEFHWLIRLASPVTPISRPKEPDQPVEFERRRQADSRDQLRLGEEPGVYQRLPSG